MMSCTTQLSSIPSSSIHRPIYLLTLPLRFLNAPHQLYPPILYLTLPEPVDHGPRRLQNRLVAPNPTLRPHARLNLQQPDPRQPRHGRLLEALNALLDVRNGPRRPRTPRPPRLDNIAPQIPLLLPLNPNSQPARHRHQHGRDDRARTGPPHPVPHRLPDPRLHRPAPDQRGRLRAQPARPHQPVRAA